MNLSGRAVAIWTDADVNRKRAGARRISPLLLLCSVFVISNLEQLFLLYTK